MTKGIVDALSYSSRANEDELHEIVKFATG